MLQEELAEKSSLSLSSIRRYEAGTSTPSLKNAELLAKALGTPVSALYGVNDTPEAITSAVFDVLASVDPTHTTDTAITSLSQEAKKRIAAALANNSSGYNDHIEKLFAELYIILNISANIDMDAIKQVFTGLSANDIVDLKQYADFLRSKHK